MMAGLAENEGTAPRANCCGHAHTVYCTGQSELKGEDVMFVEHRRAWPGTDLTESSVLSSRSVGEEPTAGPYDLDSAGGRRWLPEEFPPACPDCGTNTSHFSLFCIFDGHNGVHAAKMCGEAVLPLLESRMPLGCPPPARHPLYTQWREMLQLAMVQTVVELNRLFAERGIHAGATATIVLVHDWLLTAVNLGDSRAVLDTGAETIALSADHRVASHRGERRRVEDMGGIVAPVAMVGSGPATDFTNGIGPLRIWPGGLCLSRAIGDFDVGDSVLPFPHVTQVQLPPTGGRVLVASDGVWDAFDKMSRAGAMSRGWTTESAPSRMIQTIVRAYGGLKDDTTLVVADVLPRGTTFQQTVAAAKRGSGSGAASPGGGGGGGGCCFSGSPTVESPLAAAVRASHTQQPAARAVILDSLDVAAVMGLMPVVESPAPAWYTAEVGETLYHSAVEAAATWRNAHERRYGRAPLQTAMPQLAKQRRRRSSSGKSTAFAMGEDDTESEQPDGLAPSLEDAMMRTASRRFASSVVDGEEEYAKKFGKYRRGGGLPTGAEPSVHMGTNIEPEAVVDPSI